MAEHATNQERTAEYLKLFDREKTLKCLIKRARPVILDIGANVGSTLDEFKGWWPEAMVHCFEPQRECWEELGRRAARYAVGDVVINGVAVGNKPEDHATFYSHDISSGISGFNRINLKSLDSIYLSRVSESGSAAMKDYERSVNHERTVTVVRLDDYMDAADLRHVDLLKIDTQGYEPEVLEGVARHLAEVDVVITELMFYDYYERSLSFSDIERWLLPAGFRLYDISHISKNPMNGRTDWVDVVYVNARVRTSGQRA